MTEEVTIYLPEALGLNRQQEIQVIRAMMDALSDKLFAFGLTANPLNIVEIEEIQ